jgi:hypothetical protein
MQAIVSRQQWASGNALLLAISPGAGAIQAQAHLRDADDPDWWLRWERSCISLLNR